MILWSFHALGAATAALVVIAGGLACFIDNADASKRGYEGGYFSCMVQKLRQKYPRKVESNMGVIILFSFRLQDT